MEGKILRCAQDDREGNAQDDGGGSVQDDGGGSAQDDGDRDALDGEREKVRMREEGEQDERQKRAGMAERNLNGRR